MAGPAYHTVPGDSAADRPPAAAVDDASNALMQAFGGGESDDDSEWVDDRTASSRSSVAHEGAAGDAGAAARPASRWQSLLNRITNHQGQSQLLDGVFGNLVAKEEVPGAAAAAADENLPEDDDITPADQPPSYEEASADATPSYWETTIMATSWGDEIIVGEMPVGSILHFAWNLLISVAFSYLGFLLTYLFHTTHAAKGGSLAGFGATLIQSSYDLRPTESTPPGGPPPEFAPSDPNSFEDGPPIGYVLHPTGQPATQTQPGADSAHNSSFLANVVLVCGIVLVIKGVCDYVFAVRMQAAILKRQQAQEEVAARAQEEGRAAFEAERLEHQLDQQQGPNQGLPDQPPSSPQQHEPPTSQQEPSQQQHQLQQAGTLPVTPGAVEP